MNGLQSPRPGAAGPLASPRPTPFAQPWGFTHIREQGAPLPPAEGGAVGVVSGGDLHPILSPELRPPQLQTDFGLLLRMFSR